MSKGEYVFYKEELYIVEQDASGIMERKWLLIRRVTDSGLVIVFKEDTRRLTTAEKVLYLRESM